MRGFRSPFALRALSESGDSSTQRPLVQPVEPLLDSDKELLVDLLAMPQEMNWGKLCRTNQPWICWLCSISPLNSRFMKISTVGQILFVCLFACSSMGEQNEASAQEKTIEGKRVDSVDHNRTAQGGIEREELRAKSKWSCCVFFSKHLRNDCR